MAGRKKNPTPSATVRFKTSQAVKDDLELLAKSGYFGRNAPEAAEQIVRERIRQLRRDEPDWFISRLQS